MKESTIIGSVPAASELHKVPGFDPMKHLSKAVNAQGQPVMRLMPAYQRLWFRMACPNGRMLLNPLRITDQLAIFEAKVFFHRDDPTPASSFTANKTAQETPNYIRVAQDEALREALDNAGFGIQLCDMGQASGEGEQGDTGTPPVQVSDSPDAEQAPPSAIQSDQPQVQKAPAAASETIHIVPPQVPEERPAADVREHMEHIGTEPPPAPQPTAQNNPPQEAAPQAAAPQEVTKTVPPQEQMTQAGGKQRDATLEAPPQEQSPQAEPPQEVPGTDDNAQSSVVSILNFQAPAEETEVPQESDTETGISAEPVSEPPQEAAVNYTDDTPLEEILTLMTWEEAQAVTAPNGTCTGMTMGEVKERRPSSLRFFLTDFCKCSNIQKAAATLMVQAIEQQKAS